MSSRRRTTSTTHEWTNFEKHTLLCLMARSLHLDSNRNDEPSAARRHAYLNVATELNKAVNGDRDFGNDIDKREVSKMIEKMLVEKKGVIGKGGYMERATRGRITRGLRQMWEREPSFDYDGSLSEWNQWRKASEEEKSRIAAGGVPTEGSTRNMIESVDMDAEPDFLADVWNQAGAMAKNLYAPVNNVLDKTPATPNTTTHDSFHRLPAHLRVNQKYAWANPANRASQAGTSSMIDSYRPSCSSLASAGRPTSQFSTRHEPNSTPSLTDDYSSSPSKVSSYSGNDHPTRIAHEEARLARAIQNEMAQRRSSQFKKPGILKHRKHTNEAWDHKPGNMMHAARKALLAQPGGDEGEVVSEISGQPAGTQANGEELPFNRLVSERHAEGDIEMADGGNFHPDGRTR